MKYKLLRALCYLKELLVMLLCSMIHPPACKIPR